MSVGRRALENEDDDGDAGQDRDAADVLVDIGLIDDLAEQIGRACGRGGRDCHQRERQQIAPPIGGPLFHDEAANQDRRAIGIVSDLVREFGHQRSIDCAGRFSVQRVRVAPKRPSPCPLYRGFSSQIRACRGSDLQADTACSSSPWRSRSNFSSQTSACAAMVSRSSYFGVQSRSLRMRLVLATMVMISPALRGAYRTAKLRAETRRTASMVSSTE